MVLIKIFVLLIKKSFKKRGGNSLDMDILFHQLLSLTAFVFNPQIKYRNISDIPALLFYLNTNEMFLLYYKDLFTNKDIHTYINGVV